MNMRPVEVVILPDGRMDRKNAALYLGLKVKTLAMHASQGTGPASIKRGRVFYFRDALDEWLKSPQDAPRRGGPGKAPLRRARKHPGAAARP
jgi:hypothetical protein